MPRSPRTRPAGLLLAAILLLSADGAAALSYKLERSFSGDYSYGNSLAANARHVVIGGYFANFAAGVVDVFDRSSGALRAHLTSPVPGGYFFGEDVALDGDLLVVGEQNGGATVDYDRTGAVHLFDAETGAFLKTLVHPDPQHQFGLGTSVAVGGGVIVASAPFGQWPTREHGAVYIFDATTGALLRTLVDPMDGDGTYFGLDVALAGNEVLVSDTYYDKGGGVVWRFDLAAGALLGKLTHPDPDAEGFGTSLAVDGSRVVVGASGSALLFDLTTRALLRTFDGPFPDGRAFGSSVTLGSAGVLVTQPPWPRQPVSAQVGAALLFDADSGALRTTIAHVRDLTHTYFPSRVLLDGDDLFVSGGDDYTFTVEQYHVACGDGVVDPCERCDDGNRVGGDGCDDECQLESCGDGVTQAGEDCDDGNTVDGDGCDSNCTVSGCGNCVAAGSEQCDDGNDVTGDACDANCMWSACGNGAVSPIETCDDANTIGGDGCSPICKAEICGDAFLDAGESCDDGNHDAGDGCDPSCHLETMKLDWWKSVYGVFAGDFNPYFGRRQTTVGDKYLFILAHAGESYALVYDRETGELVHTFPDLDAGPMEVVSGGVLVGDNDIEHVVHLYDDETFELRQTFTDPTPETPYNFARYVSAIGDTVLIQDASDHGVHLFDAATGAFLRTLGEPGAPLAQDPVDFGTVMSPFHGGALLSGSNAAYLYDLATGAVLRTFTGPDGAPVLGTRAMPFGDDLLLPAPTGVVYLVDGATGAIRHTFVPPGGPENQVPWLVTVAGQDILIATTGLEVVHVYDATTFALRHTLRDPEPDNDSCFGAPVAVLDVGIAVSDQCAGEDRTGVIHVFDHERGNLIATIPDPRGDYRDFFGTRGSFGNTLITWYQADDDGVVNAWRPTIDGVLNPGEECDDGNLVNGDGCDMNGTFTHCGNGFVTEGEQCDDGNRRAGDGCEPDCTPTFDCAGTGAVSLAEARLALRNLGGRAGDETLALSGRLTGIDPAFAARAGGVQVLIADADGTPLFELTNHTSPVPPGARGAGCGKHDGWRSDGRREIYANASGALTPDCTPGSAAGLTRLVLARSGPDVTIELRARRATIPAFSGPVRVVVALGTDPDALSARCGARTFATLDCRPNVRGTALSCR